MFAVLGGEDSLRSELDTVEYYNVEDDEWSEGPPMQEARFHPCAVFDKRIGNLMVFGGLVGASPQIQSRCTWAAHCRLWRLH